MRDRSRTADVDSPVGRRSVLAGMGSALGATAIPGAVSGATGSASRPAGGSQPAEQWRVDVAGEGQREFEACLPFGDGFVLAGGVGEDETTDEGLVVRVDGDGTVQWQRRHGAVETFASLAPTWGGGFVAGSGWHSDDALVGFAPDGTVRWVVDEPVLDDYETHTTDHVVRLGDGSYATVSESSHEADSWLEFARFEPGDRAARTNRLAFNDDVFQSPLAVRAASDGGVHVLVGVGEWVVEYWRLASDGTQEHTETFDLPGTEDDRGPVVTATADGFDVVTVDESADEVRLLRLDAGDRAAKRFAFGVGDGDPPHPADVATAPDGSVAVVGTVVGGDDPVAAVALRADADLSFDWRWQHRREHPPDEPTPTAALNQPIVRPQAATFGNESLVVAGVTQEWRLEPGDAWAVSLPAPTDATDSGTVSRTTGGTETTADGPGTTSGDSGTTVAGETATPTGDGSTTTAATATGTGTRPPTSDAGPSTETNATGEALSLVTTAGVAIATVVGLARTRRVTDTEE